MRAISNGLHAIDERLRTQIESRETQREPGLSAKCTLAVRQYAALSAKKHGSIREHHLEPEDGAHGTRARTKEDHTRLAHGLEFVFDECFFGVVWSDDTNRDGHSCVLYHDRVVPLFDRFRPLLPHGIGARMQRILIVGGGAREHALALALSAHELIVAPGNAGTAALGHNVEVSATDVGALVDLAVHEKIDLVVIGPEAPLTLGLVDALQERGIRAFGPSKAASRLEGSKAFMKNFLARHQIPTAPFAVFDDAAKAKAHARASWDSGKPVVVKADGLCAGKGVVVASSCEEACLAIDQMITEGKLGDAGRTIVLEELLPGEEASFHVVCDGSRAVALVAAQDHKRVNDGDRGPNTGGMGAYAPAPVVTAEVHATVMRAVVEPTLRGMQREGCPFRGVLFVGLMIENGRPKVLEFNVRFGDPETTVLVPMLDGDWFSLLDGSARGNLGVASFGTKSGAALAVVMAAEGYPGKPASGDRIDGLDAPAPAGVTVFHAGTKRVGTDVVTAGGRVLTVSAYADSFHAARDLAYAEVGRIRFRGEHHRSDIGYHAMQHRRE